MSIVSRLFSSRSSSRINARLVFLMDNLLAIGFGLGLRFVVNSTSPHDFRVASTLIGLWEGVITLHFLKKMPKSPDPYIAYAVRLFVDFMATENLTRLVLVVIWTGMGMVLADIVPAIWHDVGAHRIWRRFRRDMYYISRSVPPLPAIPPIFPRARVVRFSPVIEPTEISETLSTASPTAVTPTTNTTTRMIPPPSAPRVAKRPVPGKFPTSVISETDTETGSNVGLRQPAEPSTAGTSHIRYTVRPRRSSIDSGSTRTPASTVDDSRTSSDVSSAATETPSQVEIREVEEEHIELRVNTRDKGKGKERADEKSDTPIQRHFDLPPTPSDSNRPILNRRPSFVPTISGMPSIPDFFESGLGSDWENIKKEEAQDLPTPPAKDFDSPPARYIPPPSTYEPTPRPTTFDQDLWDDVSNAAPPTPYTNTRTEPKPRSSRIPVPTSMASTAIPIIPKPVRKKRKSDAPPPPPVPQTPLYGSAWDTEGDRLPPPTPSVLARTPIHDPIFDLDNNNEKEEEVSPVDSHPGDAENQESTPPLDVGVAQQQDAADTSTGFDNPWANPAPPPPSHQVDEQQEDSHPQVLDTQPPVPPTPQVGSKTTTPPTPGLQPRTVPPTPAQRPQAVPPTPGQRAQAIPLPPTPAHQPKTVPPTPAQRSQTIPPIPAQQPQTILPTPTQQPQTIPPTPAQQPQTIPPTPAQQLQPVPPTPLQQPETIPPTPLPKSKTSKTGSSSSHQPPRTAPSTPLESAKELPAPRKRKAKTVLPTPQMQSDAVLPTVEELRESRTSAPERKSKPKKSAAPLDPELAPPTPRKEPDPVPPSPQQPPSPVPPTPQVKPKTPPTATPQQQTKPVPPTPQQPPANIIPTPQQRMKSVPPTPHISEQPVLPTPHPFEQPRGMFDDFIDSINDFGRTPTSEVPNPAGAAQQSQFGDLLDLAGGENATQGGQGGSSEGAHGENNNGDDGNQGADDFGAGGELGGNEPAGETEPVLLDEHNNPLSPASSGYSSVAGAPSEIKERNQQAIVIRAQIAELEKVIENLKEEKLRAEGKEELDPLSEESVVKGQEIQRAERSLEKLKKRATKRYQAAVETTQLLSLPKELKLETMTTANAVARLEDVLGLYFAPDQKTIKIQLSFPKGGAGKPMKEAVVKIFDEYGIKSIPKVNGMAVTMMSKAYLDMVASFRQKHAKADDS